MTSNLSGKGFRLFWDFAHWAICYPEAMNASDEDAWNHITY